MPPPRYFFISIHAPRVGSDAYRCYNRSSGRNFNPRSPCGERQFLRGQNKAFCDISIHAPRVGSDSPRDQPSAMSCPFQSTLPVWGATSTAWTALSIPANFNPRSPCGERPTRRKPTRKYGNFNPRSPCGERHAAKLSDYLLTTQFQSTLPVWGATLIPISRVLGKLAFQSTLPVWGATAPRPRPVTACRFQSTLPVWGATCCKRNYGRLHADFNPRSPCGERLGSASGQWGGSRISIHAPRVGSDLSTDVILSAETNFNPRSPCGERPTAYKCSCSPRFTFQSTLPVWGATFRGNTDTNAPEKFQSTLPVWGATAMSFVCCLAR